jgi:dihydroorotase
MEHDLVVEGKVVLRESVVEAQVGVDGGLIAEVKKQGVKGSNMIRAGGCVVFPGFIDSHVHLREPGWEYKEDFRTGTKAAAHGGVTTVLDMPNNPVPTTSMAALVEKKRLASINAVVDVRFFAGVVAENIGEIQSLREAAVGFKAYMGKSTGDLLLSYKELKRALERVADTGKPISLHCEEQSIIDERASALAGSKAPDTYCDMRPPEAEIESVKAVLSILARTKGARANICHVSTGGALRLVDMSVKSGNDAQCEVALHHLFFSRKAMLANPLLRTNPPLRAEDDRRALIAGLGDGRISSLVTDHAPHTSTEKRSQGLAGVPGLDDYGHVVAWLLKSVGVSPLVISKVCSSNPAAYYGFGDRGEISVGRRADLTILDLSSSEKVSVDKLMTKCGWSPYEGWEFPGKVRWTVRSGEVLLEDYELVV